MRNLCLALLALSGLPSVFAAEPKAPDALERVVSAWASVDTEGRVSGLEFDAQTPAQIAAVAETAFMRLAFDPATRGGEPVSSRTAVSARLKFTPDGGLGYMTEVIEAYQPGARTILSVHPRYPAAAAREGVGGMIWLELRINADGTVDPQQTRVVDARFHRDAKAYKGHRTTALLEAAAREAVAQWTFEQPWVEGVAIATRQRVQLKFTPPGFGPGQNVDYDYGDFARRYQNAVPVAVDDGQRLAQLIKPGAATPGH
jgi:hypothetical protein